MASDIEDDDLDALRSAVLASMKNVPPVKTVADDDDELAALREAALRTANVPTASLQDVQLSKSLSWLLRHGCEKSGLKLLQGGFLYVHDILALPSYRRYSLADVQSAVASSDKPRYQLEREGEVWKICATSGHSVEISPLNNPAIKFIGDRDTKPSARPSHRSSHKPGRRNLVLLTSDTPTPAPAPEPKYNAATKKLLVRPQDKLLSDNNSASSTPTRPKALVSRRIQIKLSNKFDRFESSGSDSDSDSSSSSSESGIEPPTWDPKVSDSLTNAEDTLPETEISLIDDDKIDDSPDKVVPLSPPHTPDLSPKSSPTLDISVESVDIALEDIPIPEADTKTKTKETSPVDTLPEPSVKKNAQSQRDYQQKSQQVLQDRDLSDFVSSSSDEEETRKKSQSRDASKTRVNSDDSGTRLTKSQSRESGDTGDKSKSIFQRLGNKHDDRLESRYDDVSRNVEPKKDMPIQKSSLLYDIISKKSPGLLMKCKTGNEVEYRRSKSAKHETEENEEKSGEKLTEREQIILQARKKKFEANKPVTAVKKTLSLKEILRRKPSKKSRVDNEYPPSPEKSVELSAGENEKEDGNYKREVGDDKHGVGDYKKQADDYKLGDEDSKVVVEKKSKHRDEKLEIKVHRKDKTDKTDKKKLVITTEKDTKHKTDAIKSKKSSKSDKKSTKNKSDESIKKRKTKKADGKPNVLSDSDSSDGEGVSWRFKHTGQSSKEQISNKKLFERPQEDIEKDKRKRRIEMPKNDRLDAANDQLFEQKSRRTNMHPFRLGTIRLDANRIDDRSDNRFNDRRNRGVDDRFDNRTRRVEPFNRDRQNRFVRADSPDTRRRKDFVDEDDINDDKTTTTITSVVTGTKKTNPPKFHTDSVSDSSPERSPERSKVAKKAKRTVHVPKSHDESENCDSRGMVVSLKRKARRVDSVEADVVLEDSGEEKVTQPDKVSSKIRVQKRVSKRDKPDSADTPSPTKSKSKKHKKRSKKALGSDKSDSEAELDAKIEKIQQNNAAIMKRRQEILDDKNRYG